MSSFVNKFFNKFKSFRLLLLFLFVSSTILIIKLNTYNINSMLHAIGSYITKSISGKSCVIDNYPSDFKLLVDQLKLLSQADKPALLPPQFFQTRLAHFNFAFYNYRTIYHLFTEIFVHKIYYFRAETNTPCIIDCGSNTGVSVLFFKTLYPHAQITAFEPAKNNFKLLEQNIKSNNFSDVTLIQKALSGKNGTATFYNAGSIAGSLRLDHNENIAETVQTTVLSPYITKNVDLLKLDIEGAEAEVIEEIANKNKLQYIKKIFLEYHFPTDGNSLAKILNIFENNGFSYYIASDSFNSINQPNTTLIYACQKG